MNIKRVRRKLRLIADALGIMLISPGVTYIINPPLTSGVIFTLVLLWALFGFTMWIILLNQIEDEDSWVNARNAIKEMWKRWAEVWAKSSNS